MNFSKLTYLPIANADISRLAPGCARGFDSHQPTGMNAVQATNDYRLAGNSNEIDMR